MSKGSYAIADQNDNNSRHSQRRNDRSYKEFICALLLFLVLCLLILLVSNVWIKPNKETESKTETFDNMHGKDKASIRTHKEHPEREELSKYEETSSQADARFKIYASTNIIQTSVTTESSQTSTTDPTTTDDNQSQEITESTFKPTSFRTDSTSETPVTTEPSQPLITDVTRTDDNKSQETTEKTSEPTSSKTNSISETPVTTEPSQSLTTDVTRTDYNESQGTPESTFKPTFSRTDSISETPVTTESSQPPTTDVTTTDDNESPETTERTSEPTSFRTDLSSGTPVSTKPFEPLTTDSTATIYNESQATTENISHPTSSRTDSTFDTPVTTKSSQPSITDSTTTDDYKSHETTFKPTSARTDSTSETAALSKLLTADNNQRIKTLPAITCNNTECIASASEILGLMNHFQNPCDNFYEFACGGMERYDDSFAEFEAYVYNRNSNPSNILKNFFSTCIKDKRTFNHRKQLKTVERLLSKVGSFLITDDDADVNLTAIVAQLILSQSMPLFEIGLDLNRSSADVILQVTLPGQSFLRNGVKEWSALARYKRHCLKAEAAKMLAPVVNLRKAYEDYTSCWRNYTSYVNDVMDKVQGLTAFAKLSPEKLQDQIAAIGDTVFKVLNNFELLPSQAQIRNEYVKKNYKMHRISDLQDHFPVFRWKMLFEIITGRSLNNNTLIQVYFFEHFHQLFQILHKVENKSLNNALLAIYTYDLFTNGLVHSMRADKTRYCASLTRNLFPDVWSQAVSKGIDTIRRDMYNKQPTIHSLFNDLKTRFCQSLEVASWIDNGSRMELLDKCDQLVLEFYEPPDKTDANGTLAAFAGNFLEDLVSALSTYKRNTFALVGRQFSSKLLFSHFLDPLRAIPFTSYSKEVIVIPLGFLHRVHSNLPEYVLMSSIGFDLARQIVRHFDPTGINYRLKIVSPANSIYYQFLQTVSDREFTSSRIFQNRITLLNVNGSLSTTERVVDNAAFRLVTDLFLAKKIGEKLPFVSPTYTEEQIFYTTAAQNYCKRINVAEFMIRVNEGTDLPPELQVEDIIGNSEAFFSAFQCPLGCRMRQFKRLIQFPYLEEAKKLL